MQILPNQVQTKIAALALLGALALAGCGHKKTAPTQQLPDTSAAASVPAPTASISSTPQTVDKGDAIVLVWRTTNATEASIDGIGPVKPNDQLMLAPTQTTTYHLTAKGDGGNADASVLVTINAPEPPPPPPPPAVSSSDMSATSDAAFHQNVQDIYFDYDSYDMRPDATTAVSQAVAWMQAHPTIKIVIGGYCDDRGSTEYNIALGENRANAAKSALTKGGVDAGRIRIVSYGKEKQFCSEETESCWQQNRRAAFQMDK
jgi:peptidoglycan-associated lipoprotein